MSGPNYYQLLSVPRDARPDEIRQAYVRLLKHIHPDLVGSTRRPAARVEDLQRAYRCLLDPASRRLHDEQLAASDNAHIARLQRVQRRLYYRRRPRRDSHETGEHRRSRLRQVDWRLILLILACIAILAKVRAGEGGI